MKRSRSGFSLIELMIAVAVFSVVMLLMSGIIVNGLRVRKSNSFEVRAQVYASTYLQKIKNHWLNNTMFNAGNIQVLPPPDGLVTPSFTMTCANLDGSTIAVTNVLTCDDIPPPLRRLSIDVYDTEGKLRAHLVTEIGNPSP
ncbi:MAG: prepilin-type N-terminal cleavage/methylation domain-containing protein [Trueperaceae bacterium]|nr:prepilin-type N-terminal cleavage/methylation domain-containing protein [Trueperaceae bacterium]